MRKVAGAVVCALVGCQSPVPGADLHVVPPGKADNYYSEVAAEFEAAATVPLDVSAGDDAGDLAERRVTAVALYLTAFVGQRVEQGDPADATGNGGFHAMVRNRSVEIEDVSAVEGSHRVSFTVDLAGPYDLLGLLPIERTDEGPTFELVIPKGATVDPAAIPEGGLGTFDPSGLPADALETVRFTIKQQPVVKNAYPQFGDFVQDGVFDLTLFYGHDDGGERADLAGARDTFAKLVELGFEAPARDFDALTRESGPFVKPARAAGLPFAIEVRLFHSDMFTADRAGQHDLALAELGGRDVFFYVGEAGPYQGFHLDPAGAADVSLAELATAPLADKQQIVVAQGSQTYAQYADVLYEVEGKGEENLDVITAVSFSQGAGTLALLRELVRVDGEGNHKPVDFYAAIARINKDRTNQEHEVLYGVMGMDGNPQLHPYANVGKIGVACTVDAECGDRYGNVCAVTTEGARRCGAMALYAGACPSGSTFNFLADSQTIMGGACF